MKMKLYRFQIKNQNQQVHVMKIKNNNQKLKNKKGNIIKKKIMKKNKKIN